MEKKVIAHYQILKAEQVFGKDGITIQFVQPERPASNEFKTHDEALQHALNSEEWFQKVFVILPLYYITEKRN